MKRGHFEQWRWHIHLLKQFKHLAIFGLIIFIFKIILKFLDLIMYSYSITCRHATIVVIIYCCDNTTTIFVLLQQVQQWKYITKFKVYFAVIGVYQLLIFKKFLGGKDEHFFRKFPFSKKNLKKIFFQKVLFLETKLIFFQKVPFFGPKIKKK